MKFVPPSVKETAFNCPHCGALTTQFWHSVTADQNSEQRPTPKIILDSDERDFDFEEIEDKDVRTKLVELVKDMKTGRPFLKKGDDRGRRFDDIHNLNISCCYNCKEISIWIHDRLTYPVTGEAPAANPDMPRDIRRDYQEASAILGLSPRGAAALLRLAIQKLCKELGQPGKNLNDDIGELVKRGLDPRVQEALDVVRVIGNEAVHPGNIDLRDDRATAETLFKLLNLIVDKTLSEPKHVKEAFDSLPEGALEAIKKRDGSGRSVS